MSKLLFGHTWLFYNSFIRFPSWCKISVKVFNCIWILFILGKVYPTYKPKYSKMGVHTCWLVLQYYILMAEVFPKSNHKIRHKHFLIFIKMTYFQIWNCKSNETPKVDNNFVKIRFSIIRIGYYWIDRYLKMLELRLKIKKKNEIPVMSPRQRLYFKDENSSFNSINFPNSEPNIFIEFGSEEYLEIHQFSSIINWEIQIECDINWITYETNSTILNGGLEF